MRCLFALGGLLLVLAVAGSPLRAVAADNTARIRIIHAAPDTPPVDVLVDERVVLSNATFPSISLYLAIPAGAHTITVAAKNGTPVLTTQASFEAGGVYTVAAIGLANVAAEVYRDDLAAPPAGKARVRVIHTSPDAPGADVEVVDGPTLVQNLAFTEASPYLTVDAGSYNLRLVVGGDTTVVVPLPNTTFRAGTIYDVVAVGRLANIKVVSSTFTPPPAGSGEMRTLMPSTGASSTQLLLLTLGLLTLLGGLIIQRRATTRRAVRPLPLVGRARRGARAGDPGGRPF